MSIHGLTFLLIILLESFTAYSIEINVEPEFKNFMFIHENGLAEDFQADLIKYLEPKVILRCPEGRCTIVNGHPNIPNGLKQYPRYGPHRYTHIFYKVESDNIINQWKELYGQLTLTRSKEAFFVYATRTYKKYAHYDVSTFKEDYWRSQWNQDEFVIQDGRELIFNSFQPPEGFEFRNLPTRLRKSVKFSLEISEYKTLFYSTLSGWTGSRCKFFTLDEQLYSLTVEFNAYDTLFCDVFSYYNLTFQTNYAFDNHRWVRAFLLRDDLISSFPPDPNAVFYGSPGVTFIVLKEKPIIWDNIFRPFSHFLWAGIGVSIILITIASLTFSKVCDHLRWKLANPVPFRMDTQPATGSEIDTTSSERMWIISVRIFKFVIMASYGGMILAGLLDPSYPWSPKTFKELNKTTNFIAATAYNSPVTAENIISSFTLNGIGMENWRIRIRADPGNYLVEDDADKLNRYALLMYDDKKYHYIYGRSQLYFTANYSQNLETDKEVILKEMRYVSAAPGATAIHFLIDGIKRGFESGSWMKWKYLEENYFKYVAPNTIRNYGINWFDREPALRSLNKMDILTTIYIWTAGLVISGVVLIAEFQIMKVSICKLLFGGVVAKGVALVVLMFINCCLGSGYRLQRLRSFLLDCRR